jgi:hypothetical protein
MKNYSLVPPWHYRMVYPFAAFIMFFCGCSRVAFLSPSHPYDYSILENKQTLAAQEIPELEKRYYESNADEKDKFIYREQIVFTLMDLIDMYQYKFNSEFYGRSATFTSIGEITAGGLSAAAAVVTPLSTSHLLAALSTAALASTSIVSKNFIQNKAIDLLVDRMEATRKEIRARIIKNMKQETSDYPLGQALLDVQEYARGGTIFGAIRAINKDNANAQEEADTALKKASEEQKPANTPPAVPNKPPEENKSKDRRKQ